MQIGFETVRGKKVSRVKRSSKRCGVHDNYDANIGGLMIVMRPLGRRGLDRTTRYGAKSSHSLKRLKTNFANAILPRLS
jgi:hypothetical protein